MDEKPQYTLYISNIPENHIVAGHLTYLKVLDENGEEYWAMRTAGLNLMEGLGCATDMANEARNAIEKRSL